VTAFTMREATLDDLDWIAEQEVAVFGSGAWSRDSIAADLSAPETHRIWSRRYIVAEVDGERAGYAVFGFESDVFSLLNLVVVPEARRRGVGDFLLDRFFDDARTLRLPAVELEVATDNAPALALYRSHGFEEVRIRRRYYQPGDRDAVVMRRRL
jgi:[ribosomal protein S18]-alanine N-acetyltransferase